MNTALPGETVDQSVAGVPVPAALLWDMDGTLVDTEPYWIETEYALAAEYGAEWSQADAHQLVGNDLLVSGEYIRTRMGLPLSAEQVVERLLDGVVARVEQHVPWRPGARELLLEAHAVGRPCALVTMSWTRFVTPILAALPDGVFTSVVTGDRVSRGKPHPEPYLLAARELDLTPAECLALEDSETGATSAVAAGCPVLVVPCVVTPEAGPGRRLADTLQGTSLADLDAVWHDLSAADEVTRAGH